MQKISKAVGIDLGTTNSAVGLMNPSDTDVILHRDSENRETTPSCVWRDPESGEIVVGHRAFARCGTVPTPARSFKTHMGDAGRVDLGGGVSMLPEELSAEVLKEMRRQIEEDARRLSTSEVSYLVDRAIVTVPAYFDQPRVAATRRAAEREGLTLVDLLQEPVAAATYHCWRTQTRDGVFMVYDLGGGTFDVTILKITAGAPLILSLSGHTQLGGDNMDTAIAEGMLQQLKDQNYALDLDLRGPEDKLRFDLLKYLAEGVKKGLSDRSEYVLRDSSTLQDKNGRPVIFNTLFERSQVVAWMKPVIDRTISYCWDALEKAEKKSGIRLSDLDQIILAGGSTHIPAVRDRVRKEFCKISQEEFGEFQNVGARDDRPIAPLESRARCGALIYEKADTIVALGAAIRAAAMGGLHLTDPNGTVRVEVKGVAVEDRHTTQVTGHVKALTGTSLADARICLYVPEPEYQETVDLGEDGYFYFTGVPLTPATESQLNFEILNGAGECIAVVARSMRKGVSVATGGQRTGCLPKAITMDVMNDNVVERKVLLPDAVSLPATANFELRHPGGTDQIHFILYQRQRFIKKVVVPVPPSLPKNTRIDLTINVDEFSFITMRGKIGEIPIDAAVGAPPPRNLPTKAEVDALERKFNEALPYLQPGDKMTMNARYQQTMKAHQAALERSEDAAALHEYEELEDLVARVERPIILLQPPRSIFDDRVRKISKLSQAARAVLAENGKPLDKANDWEDKLDVQRQAGEKAYLECNKSSQKDLADALQQLAELEKDIIAFVNAEVRLPELTDAERAQAGHEHCRDALSQIKEIARASKQQDVEAEAETLDAELQEAAFLAEKDPRAAVARLVTIRQEIRNVADKLFGPKLPPIPGI